LGPDVRSASSLGTSIRSSIERIQERLESQSDVLRQQFNASGQKVDASPLLETVKDLSGGPRKEAAKLFESLTTPLYKYLGNFRGLRVAIDPRKFIMEETMKGTLPSHVVIR